MLLGGRMRARALVRTVAVAAVAGLVACSSGAPPAPRAAKPAARGAAAKPISAPGAPRVEMSAAEDSVPGVLTRWCVGSDCDAGPPKPSRYLELGESGVVLFVVGAAPARATAAVVTGAGESRPVPLDPGTTMAFAPGVPPGKHLVELSAQWGERRGRWVFGISVPRD